jgi:SRSO17 transposase
VPTAVKFRTRQELALEMLDECGVRLPHAWVAGDNEMGRPSGFRQQLRGRNERYLLGVPSNTLVRDLDVPPPESAGHDRRPQTPFARLDRWRATLAEDAWTEIEVRDGEKGPLVIEAVKRRVQARTATGGTGPAELLLVTRERQGNGTYKFDYYLSYADAGTPLWELARVAKAAHRVEECFERARGEAGLADYQERNWIAWHHHQTLSLLAAWFLNQETRRGKNPDPRADVTAVPATDRGAHRESPPGERAFVTLPSQHPLVAAQRTRQAVLPSFT